MQFVRDDRSLPRRWRAAPLAAPNPICRGSDALSEPRTGRRRSPERRPEWAVKAQSISLRADIRCEIRTPLRRRQPCAERCDRSLSQRWMQFARDDRSLPRRWRAAPLAAPNPGA